MFPASILQTQGKICVGAPFSLLMGAFSPFCSWLCRLFLVQLRAGHLGWSPALPLASWAALLKPLTSVLSFLIYITNIQKFITHDYHLLRVATFRLPASSAQAVQLFRVSASSHGGIRRIEIQKVATDIPHFVQCVRSFVCFVFVCVLIWYFKES